MKKIIVTFARVDNVVIGKLEDFPRELCGKGVIIDNGAYSIRSVSYSDMTSDILYLSGSFMRKENLFAKAFPSTDKAKEALKNWKQLIQDYNSRPETDELDEDSISVAWERAE